MNLGSLPQPLSVSQQLRGVDFVPAKYSYSFHTKGYGYSDRRTWNTNSA